ncbi:bifunctional glycosyltransferase/CDP-glycerol:glycerophosphate glycerophosphotransferase [Nocardioides sp. SYSU DS0651]|uniref:bifunctional glycosyltransferase/CDP-glycerol:glycerophosphate glycerophosphotransferase n=1 Tax=Nocardioides sp. SYSU DS0651 TaxID=3415955 RepID=UPI003F4B339D
MTHGRLPRLTRAIGRRLRGGRPALTVVVPTLDSADHLDGCLRSLRRQQLADVEVVVVDLGSTDGTAELVERHRVEDGRIRLVRASSTVAGAPDSVADARNAGAREARGDYVAFVDPEDGVTPHGLRFAVDALERSGSDYAVFAQRPWRRGRVLEVPDAERTRHERAERLTGPSVAAAGPVPASRCVFRRSWYDAGGLAFHGPRPAEGRHAAEAATTASSVDWLPHVGSLRLVDRDRSPLTRAPDPATAVTEAGADVRAGLDLLPDGGVRAAAAARALTDRLAGFVQLAWAEDDAYWQALVASVRPVLEVAGDAVTATVPAYEKVLLELVRGDDRAAALRFLGGVRATARHYPLVAEAPGPVVDFGAEWRAVEERHRLLADVELTVRSEVLTARPTGAGVLELTGWAYLDNVDLAGTEPGIALAAEGPGGQVVPLRTLRTDCTEADVASGLHHADVTSGGFTARLDTSSLGDGPWTLWATVTVARFGGVERTGRVAITPWAMAGVAAWSEGPQAFHVDHDDMGRLELHVRTPTAWLRGAGERSGDLLLDVDGGAAWLQHGADRTALGRDPDGRAVVPLDRLEAGAGDHVLHAGGRLPTAARPVAALPGTAASPHVQVDRRGRVVVRPRARAALVTGARLVGEALEADVLLDAGVAGWRAAVVDGRSVAEGTVERIDGDHHRVRVPLRTTLWGRETCLRSGRYALSLANDRHPDWFVPAPSADLCRALPAEELQERMRLRVEAFSPDRPGVRVVVAPPLADDERGERHQRLLREAARVPVADRRSVFLRAMFGEYANGNGLGLHEELVRRGSDLELLWSVVDRSVAVPPGGTGVVERSRAWHEAVARSRYHMVDVHQVRWFERPEEQVLIQTFHGYPYKIMGQDWWRKMGNDPAEVGSLHRRTRDWSALVSPAGYASPLLRRAFLEPACAEHVPVLEVGYPRNDVLQRPEAAQVRREARALLGIPDGAVAVLYAPTFRDYLSADDLTARRVTFFDAEAALAALPDDHVLLIRGHAFNARVHDDRLRTGPRLIDVTDHPDPNHLMLASDVGVLDYSSLRFDYVLTGNPMVFLVPDLAQYHRFRGGVVPYEPTAPGPLVDTTDEVVSWISDLPRLRAEFAAAREEFRRSYVELDDGRAAARLVDALFAPRGDA